MIALYFAPTHINERQRTAENVCNIFISFTETPCFTVRIDRTAKQVQAKINDLYARSNGKDVSEEITRLVMSGSSTIQRKFHSFNESLVFLNEHLTTADVEIISNYFADLTKIIAQ